MENKKNIKPKTKNGYENENKNPNEGKSEDVEKPHVPVDEESQPTKEDEIGDEQKQEQVQDDETDHTEEEEEGTPLLEEKEYKEEKDEKGEKEEIEEKGEKEEKEEKGEKEEKEEKGEKEKKEQKEEREVKKGITLEERSKESQKDKQAIDKGSKARQHRSYLEKFSTKKKPKFQEKKIPSVPNDDSSEVITESEEQPADVIKLPKREEEKVEEDSLHEDSVTNFKNMVDGVVASVLSKLTSHPLDVMQRRYQLAQVPKKRSRDSQNYLANLKHKKASYRSIIYDAKVLYIERGLIGFYKGLAQAMYVNIFQTTTLFWTFEYLRPILNNQPLVENVPLLNFAAGFVSGAAAGLVAHPLFKIAQHMQATSKIHEKQSTMRMWYRILRKDGYRKFYRGISSTMLYISPLHGFKFMFYNIFCDYELEKPEYENRDEIAALSLLTAGAAAGLISNFLTFPLDLIRQRLQMSSLIRQRYNFDATCRTIRQCLVLVVQREGFIGLYRGIVPCLMRSSVNTAVQFSVFDKMHKWARSDYDLVARAT